MGSNKALLPLNGKPMIEHVASTLRNVVPWLTIVSDHADPYRFLNLPIIPDLVRDAGPLGGIHAALSALAAPAVLVVGCDTPFLSVPLLQYLLNTPHTSSAIIARADNRVHPLCGIYHREALPRIGQFLSAGRFKLLELVDELGADIIDITPSLPFYRPDLFTNVNDLPDYHQIEKTGDPEHRQ
jgi:molybdopterin-guanine dinucleotide biosynthesis protein A